MPENPRLDVIVIGGGPAGLSAALLLGRSRRRVLLIDSGQQRNLAARALHGYLTRDGISPARFLELAREELKPYGVQFRHGEVVEARCVSGGDFQAVLDDGTRYRSRKLLLATGVADRIPVIEGIDALYGKSVFHCPYCDGWEVRDKGLAAYGRGRAGVGLASSLKLWSPDVVLVTDGHGRLDAGDREKLLVRRIPVRAERIVRLEGRDGRLQRIHFRSGDPLDRDALFFTTGQMQHSDLPQKLGCPINPKGTIPTDRRQRTAVPGLYVVGDIARDVQFAIVAAAEGARAAIAINTSLIEEDQAAPGKAQPRSSRVSG